jgi:hypothetical protein
MTGRLQMVIARWQVKNRVFLAILSRANHATGLGVESLLPLTQHFQTMFRKSAAHARIPLQLTVTSTTALDPFGNTLA